MFTMKSVESNRQFAVECQSYAYELGKDGVARLFGYETPYQTEEYKAFFGGIEAPSSTPGTRSVYVMNEAGSTVAQYHWWIENAEGSPLASSGEPPKYTADSIDPSELTPA